MYSFILACSILNLTASGRSGTSVPRQTPDKSEDLLLLLIRKTVPTSVTDPGAIESAFGAVREVEQSSRCKDNALSRPLSPIRKAVVNPTVASARLPSRWSHNNQLLLGRELELKFAIIRTKFDKS